MSQSPHGTPIEPGRTPTSQRLPGLRSLDHSSRTRLGRHADSVRRLRDLLRAQMVRAGSRGARLPREHELMAEHDASRTTVREALTLLSEEGLVRRLQGQGTFVLDLPALVSLREYHGVGDPQPASLLGGAIRSHVLDEQVVPAPRDLASMLECPLGSPTLRVDYVAVVGDERIVVATNYVRMPEGQAVAAVPFRTDWYVRLADAGVAVGETDMLIEAGLADEFDADLLGIRPGDPIMIMEQIIRGDTGAPFNLAVLRSAGRKLSLLSRHRRSDRE